MLRTAFLIFSLALVLICLAPFSHAARQDAGAFSAELPDGWTMTKEDELIRFAEPDGPAEITVILRKYEKPEVKAIITEMVGQTPVNMLADNIYLYEDSSGTRGWSMIGSDGLFVDIGANMPVYDMNAFLSGLKAAEEEKGLAEIFAAALASDEAVEWLAFADDGKGDLIEEEEGTPYTHKSFTAIIPDGWTASEKGDSVVFSSEATKSFVVVRVLVLASDDGKAFTAYATEQAKKLGGKNIEAREGVVNFTADEGASGMLTQFGKKCLLLIFEGEDPKTGYLIKSIDIPD